MPQSLISDELLNSKPLEHHGIKGMKWGVWNAETRKKYMGGKGRKISAKMVEIGKIGKEKVKAFSDARIEERKAKKQEREDVQAQRKELGMTRAKYNKLRETTLKSHDPRVVERGMRTLTDLELDQKLERLKKEEQISKMSTDLSKRKSEARDARNRAIKSNPVYSVGMNLLGKSVSKAAKALNESAKNSDKNDSGSNKNDSGGNNSSAKKVSRKPAPYRQSGSGQNESVRKVVKESSVYNQVPSYDSAKSAASRGERLLSDGTLRDTIIDVRPVSATSERQEARTRRAQPAVS